MQVHDWTLVDAGIFHGFHTLWIGQINIALNEGLLPKGYYALPEQHAGESIADILTLHGSTAPPSQHFTSQSISGGTAVADAPPRVRRQQTLEGSLVMLRRTLAIRHVSGHHLIAMLEIISPANKDRAKNIARFVEKAAEALDNGIHLLIVDLFPPGRHDPQGIHGAMTRHLSDASDPYDLPSAEPLTLAAYAAGRKIEVYLEHLATGRALPDMPLFLRADRYINVPLEQTYQTAYRGMPAFYRDVLEGRTPE